MQSIRPVHRAVLLALSLLSACAANGVAQNADAPDDPAQARLANAFGDYLVGRFAASENQVDEAAQALLAAHAADPGSTAVLRQAFLAAALAGLPQAGDLAQQLPDNPAAQLLLGDNDVRAGRWASAQQRFDALPHEGLTQVVQPLLVAWAQQGGGDTNAALDTLRPYMQTGQFRGVYTLHAALIADLAGREMEASQFYHLAQTEFGGTNLRLAQILANWEQRRGHPDEGHQILESLNNANDSMGIVVPALVADMARRPVSNPREGIAESYIALAAALHQQQTSEFSLLLLQLALDLRPDFAAARLLMSDIQQSRKLPAQAFKTLAPIADSNPLIALVQLRRAALEEQLGQTDQAIALLQSLAKSNPERTEPLIQLGDLYARKNRFGEAITAYSAAIARVSSPGRADWVMFYARGTAYDQNHQWPLAEADLQHALQLSPEQPYVMNYLGYSWAEQGHHLAQAHKLLERAVALSPNDGAIVDSYGWVLLRQHDYAGAVHWLEHAVELEPEDSTINGHLGDAYWAAGHRQQARMQWQRALNLNPSPDDAVKLHAKLNEAEAGRVSPASATP
jgi:Flp pilus assembly protein TadD